jgi:glycerophosphoryl diester phosphodiesterase
MKNIIPVIFILLLGIKIMFGQTNKVKITAHRGASAYAPENTLASMKEAIQMNADYAELDAQETADGKIIILHDGNLKRTTGLDKNIWEVKFEDLENLDAGNWFGDKFKAEHIPQLSNVIDLVNGKIKLNIELKTNGHEKILADRVVKVIQEKDFSNNCFFTSFDYSQIKRVKDINPVYKVGLIFRTYPADINVFTADIEALSVHFSLVDEAFMKKAREHGKEVHVWTVNEEKEMERLISLGVTSIITNYPDKLKKILNERR